MMPRARSTSRRRLKDAADRLAGLSARVHWRRLGSVMGAWLLLVSVVIAPGSVARAPLVAGAWLLALSAVATPQLWRLLPGVAACLLAVTWNLGELAVAPAIAGVVLVLVPVFLAAPTLLRVPVVLTAVSLVGFLLTSPN